MRRASLSFDRSAGARRDLPLFNVPQAFGGADIGIRALSD